MSNRKRQRNHQEVKYGISGVLKGASQRVGKGKFAEALALLDKTAGSPSGVLTPQRQCQIAALAGDIEFKQGKFASAYEIYNRAELLAGDNNNRVWFRAVVGQIRSLLKEVRAPEAYDIAQKAWAKAVEKYEAHQKEIKEAQIKLQNGGGVLVVKERPHRPSVVGGRLGQLFLQEGEIQSAKEFFLKAIDYNPQGGCRARIGLAQIALRENNFLEVLLRANQALVMGKLSAKTLCAWPLYISARQKLKQKGVESDLLNTLSKSKLSGVRARAILVITRTLRNYEDESWQSIAQNWLVKEGETQSIIAAELRKILLSEAKLTNQNQEQAAGALLATEKLSANEYLAATKAKLRAQLQQGKTFEVNGLVDQGAKIYGANFAAKLRHGLALVLWQAQQLDSANLLLAYNVQTLAKNKSQWSKSTWALGQLEESQSHYLKAAEYFDLVAKETSVPLRFQLQAMLNWITCLVASGQTDVIVKAKEKILAATTQIEDWELLLNLARQLYQNDSLKELAYQIFSKGEKLAWVEFESSIHPLRAINILWKLTSRQGDLEANASIIKIWESLSNEKKDWLWSDKAEFWEYLGFVCWAYFDLKDPSKGESLVLIFLNDLSTSPSGRVILGSMCGERFTRLKDFDKAFVYFDIAIASNVNHEQVARAYYWKALKAYKNHDQASLVKCLKCLTGVLKNSNFKWQTHLKIKNELLKNDLVISDKMIDEFRDKTSIERQLKSLKDHLTQI